MKQKIMKNVTTHLAASAAMVALTVGVFGSSQALAGIASTKHNLGTGGTGANHATAGGGGTAEICVFCHTPHGANIGFTGAPLWNRATPSGTYTTYNTLGTSSLTGATAPVGSVSLACLSCHDGTQAMNVVINQPGSGTGVSGAELTGTWTGVKNLSGTGITNIGVSLTNDHPIGIQYGGGMPSGGAYTTANIAKGALKDDQFEGIQYANLNGNSVWWVDSGTTANARDKGDMMLYTRSGSGSINRDGTTGSTLTGAQAFVECASCHDPHTETATFLRKSNAGSAVCLACHTK